MNVPVTFEYKSKTYKGELQRVMGAGDVFYLMVDNFYWGRLRYVNEWVFDTNDKTVGMEQLAEYLGGVVIAWYDSQ